MEDWKQKLLNAIKPYVGEDSGSMRRAELREWLLGRELNKVIDIKSAQHAIEIMELIDRWHDEDVAKQPCAAPAQPVNPFIEERVERFIKRGTIGYITVKAVNYQFVNLNFNPGTCTPDQLRNLAKQLADLADAHEAIYPPTDDTCAKAC